MNGKKDPQELKGMEVKTWQTDVFYFFQRLVMCLAPKYTNIGSQVWKPTEDFSDIRKKAFGTSGLRIKNKVEEGSSYPLPTSHRKPWLILGDIKPRSQYSMVPLNGSKFGIVRWGAQNRPKETSREIILNLS